MVQRKINNKIEFEEFMSEIDTILRDKDVSVEARAIQALAEAGRLLGIRNMRILPIQSKAIKGVYEGESLLAHIVEWVQGRYGNRLNVDFAFGYSLILIRGTPWLIKFPYIIGKVRVLCERDLDKKFENFVVNKVGEPQKRPKINLLSLIQHLPQQLAIELTDVELKSMLDHFIYFFDFFIKSNDFYKNENLIMIGISDLKDSANYCINGKRTCGLSKWASLQAAEKFLKFYIQQKGEEYPNTHNLSRLENQAYNLGLPNIERDIINEVQCSASVRYETSQDSTLDVVNAHFSALKIGDLVIKSLTSE